MSDVRARARRWLNWLGPCPRPPADQIVSDLLAALDTAYLHIDKLEEGRSEEIKHAQTIMQRETMKRCMEIAALEKVGANRDDDSSDIAYDLACKHIIEAIEREIGGKG